MAGQACQRRAVVSRWVLGDCRTTPTVVRQVGDQNILAPIEDSSARVGIPKEETTLHPTLGIVAEGVQPSVDLLQVQPQVAEEFVVVLDLGCAPNLRRGPAHIRIPRFNQGPGIVALGTAAGLVSVQKLKAEVGKTAVGQRQPEVGGDIHFIAVAVVVLTVAGLDGQPLPVFAQPEVQNAGDGVRAVLGGGAIAQDFDPLQGNGWNRGNIGPV